MKNKKRLAIAFGFIIVAALVWWFAPKKFLRFVHETEVSSVTVRNGNNGNVFEIKNKDDIRYIVREIKKYKFQKDGISLFLMGTEYTFTFYDFDGEKIIQFIVNEDDTIRKDPFFYKTGEGNLQNVLEYLSNIEND